VGRTQIAFKGLSMKKLLLLLTVFVGLSTAADNVAPSFTHPGDLPLDSVPIFICFGWDDNVYYDGLHWADTLFASRKNPDGTPILSTYYVSTHPAIENDSLWEEIEKVYLQGNEIGNHTQTHDGEVFSANMSNKELWSKEIGGATADLFNQSNIPAEAITGFRTPFLLYTGATFEAMQDNNIEYDCSIEHFATQYQKDDGSYGVGLIWPYTLDEGPHASSYPNSAGKVSGMWELPVHEFQPATGWKGITGFDWNLWFKEGLNKQGVIDLWKSSLKVRVEGDPARSMLANRVPFFLGTHTDEYTDENEVTSTASDNTVNRRAAFAEFIDWALEYNPAVRIVPQRAVIQWMRNPVPYTQFTYTTGLPDDSPSPDDSDDDTDDDDTENIPEDAKEDEDSETAISLQNQRMLQKDVAIIGANANIISLRLPVGTYSLHLYNSIGRLIETSNITSTGGVVSAGLKTNSIGKGLYFLQISQGGKAVLQDKIIVR
jgi:hypothetical protein